MGFYNLDKKGLASLVRGTDPSYNKMNHPLIEPFGTYRGGHNDEWTWNYKFEDKLTEDELWEMYGVLTDN